MQTELKLNLSRVFLLDSDDFQDKPIINLFVTGFVLGAIGLAGAILTDHFGAPSLAFILCCAGAALGLAATTLGVYGYLLRGVAEVVGYRRNVRHKKECDTATAELRAIVAAHREELEQNDITEIRISYLEEPFAERSIKLTPAGDRLPADVQDAIRRLFKVTVEEHLDYSLSWERGSLTLEVESAKITWSSEKIHERAPKECDLAYEPKPAVVL